MTKQNMVPLCENKVEKTYNLLPERVVQEQDVCVLAGTKKKRSATCIMLK